MKVLITGGLGFIGINLALYLSDRGYSLRLLDRGFTRPRLLFKRGIYDVVYRNVRDENCLTFELQDIDVVVHLAGSCSTAKSISQPIEDFKTNALGTVNVLYAAAKLQIPVIYTSSCKVYSAQAVNESNGYINESVSVTSGSRSPYGTSKLVGELYCQEFGEMFESPIIINRLSTIFGPYQRGTEESGWVSWFCHAVKSGLSIIVYGDGNQVRDPLWVEDLCELLEDQIKNVNTYAGGVFNVGGGYKNSVSLLDVVRYLKIEKVNFQSARFADLQIYVSDMTKLFAVSPWRPKVTVFEGIDKIQKGED